jgi:RNA polymerase sigma-70 factor (ECF subfamily)
MIPADLDRELLLIQRSQRGDAEALTELYQLFSAPIYRYCLLRVGDAATAEDLTAEVFLNMIESLPRYVSRGAPFGAWLFRIAHNRVSDHRRRQARHGSAPISESLHDAGPAPEEVAMQGADLQHVWSAAGKLSDDYQMVLQLRFIEGLSLEETARLMGKSIGAIKVMQHRGLRRLAALLAT